MIRQTRIGAGRAAGSALLGLVLVALLGLFASCAAPMGKDLQGEKAHLGRRLGPRAAPETHRDYGWVLSLLGDTAAGQAELGQARAGFAERSNRRGDGRSDARTLLGLALRAQDTLQAGAARDLWTALLEGYDSRDPWAPASAEMAAHRLLNNGADAPDGATAEQAYAERLMRLWQRSAELPPEARQYLAAFTGQVLRLAGREKEAQQVDTQRGCPAVFYVSGPLGKLARLDQATAFPPDDPARDPDRGAYRRQAARGCELTFDGGVARSGVFYAVSWVKLAGGPVPLSIETVGEVFSIYVDGAPSYRDDEPIRRRLLWLDLPAGWHAIAVKVSAPEGRGQFQLALPGGEFYDGPPGATPATVAGVSKTRPVAGRVKLRRLSPLPAARFRSGQVVAHLLAAEQADITGSTDAGVAQMDSAMGMAPRFAPLLLIQANLYAGDSSRPQRIVRDRVRRALAKALEQDPTLLRARLNLANMELQEDHAEQALALLDQTPGQAPGQPDQPGDKAGQGGDQGAPAGIGWQALLLRYRILKARGWLHDAEETLHQARAVGPAACPPLEALIDLRHELKDDHGALAAAGQLAACNPYSERLADSLRNAGDLAAAQQEYERLLRLDPDNESLRHGLAEVLYGRADAASLDRARDILTALIARYPRTSFYRVRLANVLVERGHREEAEAALRAGLLVTPESADLHRALLALGVPSVMDPYRVDGRQVIKEYLADKKAEQPGEGEPAVIVLDRTVTWVSPTGARLTLTHNIIRVLTKDGIDKFGEVQVPEGADVLTLRTVKADGSTREPEEITEKETISAPDLETGDYVEFEYVDRQAPAPSLPGGFIGERFYFASPDAPLHRTEYVLVTPWDMPLQLDLRGKDLVRGVADLPQERVEHRGGLRVTTWARRDVARIFPEPPTAEAVSAEWLPSVRAASGLSFAGWRDYLRDRLYETLRPNDELRHLAQAEAGAVAGGNTPTAMLQRARRLDAWVRKNIKGGGTLDEAATAVLARREGNRVVLLGALLRAAGVPFEVGLVRPVTAAQLDGPLPDVEAFGEPLLAIAPGQGAGGGPLIWIDPSYRHGPAGLLRPPLRGGRVLRVVPPSPGGGAEASFLTLDQASDGATSTGATAREERSAAVTDREARSAAVIDRRRISLQMNLAADGSGEVSVNETLTGWPALEWREELERMSDGQVRQELEQRLLGFYFPGASLDELHYGPLDDDNVPLVVSYRFHAPQLAKVRSGKQGAAQRSELVLPAPYPAFLGKRYVGVPQRRTPLVLVYTVPTELDAKVKLPPGAGAPQLAPQLALDGFGHFVQQVSSSGGELRIHGEFAMSSQRVESPRYPDFVRFAAQVDSAESAVAVIPLGPPADPK